MKSARFRTKTEKTQYGKCIRKMDDQNPIFRTENWISYSPDY